LRLIGKLLEAMKSGTMRKPIVTPQELSKYFRDEVLAQVEVQYFAV